MYSEKTFKFKTIDNSEIIIPIYEIESLIYFMAKNSLSHYVKSKDILNYLQSTYYLSLTDSNLLLMSVVSSNNLFSFSIILDEYIFVNI